MVNKIMSVVIEAILPKSYLQDFVQNCSQIKFEGKLTPRPQFHTQMFYPFYYKDPFVHDCIFELKERNSSAIARLFGEILSRWITRKIEEVFLQNPVITEKIVIPIQKSVIPNSKKHVIPAEAGIQVRCTLSKNIPRTVTTLRYITNIPKRDSLILDPCSTCFDLSKQKYSCGVRRDDKTKWNDEPTHDDRIKFYLTSVPQHISKTKEKGFCHTTTLALSIETILKKKYPTTSIQFFPCIKKIKKTKRLHDTFGKKVRFKMIQETMKAHVTKEDAQHAYFFIIDDIYTTGATFKEIRRSLSDCAVPHEHVFFVSIAH